MEKLSDKVRGPIKKQGPLWTGPSGEGKNGGVTQSLIGRFLNCRERFRLHAVLGLRPGGGWNHRMGYGSMWHVCEEALASEVNHFGHPVGTTLGDDLLLEHVNQQCCDHPLDREKIFHWANVCRKQFPIYVRHWAKHPDVVNRTPLLSEQAFDVPYKLPSGRTVRLRGKLDSVDLVHSKIKLAIDNDQFKKQSGIWLQENKTKGDVDVQAIQRQLTFDLQTMLYLVALHVVKNSTASDGPWLLSSDGGCSPETKEHEIAYSGLRRNEILGVRYNVVRRPLSGGKGSIVKHKATKNQRAETDEEFYDRMAEYIKAEPDHYFQRFNCFVSEEDVAQFRKQCLDPILEEMACWYAGQTGDPSCGDCQEHNHWRHPFGVHNPMDDGGFSDIDAWMDGQGTAGLRRTEVLFPELE